MEFTRLRRSDRTEVPGETSTKLPTRADWRDSIERSGLTPKARTVAKQMADFWPKPDAEQALWCNVDTLIDRTGFSRSSIYRALRELELYGYLIQVDGHRQHRSPRYLPRVGIAGTGGKAAKARGVTVPRQRCQDDNPEVSDRNQSPYVVPTEPPPGSDDLDFESPPKFAETPTDARERRDFAKLAQYMTNYNPDAVALIYKWMRTGHSLAVRRNTPQRWPGGYAATLHAKTTGEEGVSQWQGHFTRHYLNYNGQPHPVSRISDPWATSA